MKPQVTVVDYGIGNILSVCRALEAAGAEVTLAENAEGIKKAERLVLPGVGAFADCMDELRKRELIAPLKAYFVSGRPFLGICVGMQVMFDIGEEFGEFEGLGLVRGRVKRLPETTTEGERLRIPNIGWLDLMPASIPWEHGILSGLPTPFSAYFLHSYACQSVDPKLDLAYANFGGHRVLAAINQGRAYGVQFHPERSGPNGLKILEHFSKL